MEQSGKKSPFIIFVILGVLSILLGIVGDIYHSVNYFGEGAAFIRSYGSAFESELLFAMESTQWLNMACIAIGALLLVLAIVLKFAKIKFESNVLIITSVAVAVLVILFFAIANINAYNYFSNT